MQAQEVLDFWFQELTEKQRFAKDDALDATLATLVEALMGGAPQAQKAAKQLITAISGRPIDDAVLEETAQRIARQRATDEAKNGIASFLEKRTPAWLL